ncbi:MAG: queuosine salvage family protein [Candidatus Aureabacteria bacterium]|nr:queuosine salvage family protein [Candidatus Auribacterota bacterium]
MRATVLESVRPIINDLRHVEIDAGRVQQFCEERPARAAGMPDWKLDFAYPWDNEGAADFFLLFNCINFAFWAKGNGVKWRVEYKGKEYDGAYGLMAALTRALDEGMPLLEGAFLGEISDELLGHILRGRGELVLFSERAAILREVGRGLAENYGGRFRNLLRAAQGSASAVAGLLVTRFPSFNDACIREGREIKFYKRAQLAPAMIYQRFGGRGPGAFSDIDDLTVFADYKLPQMLRRLDVLRYREGLAAKVDSRTPLPPCSEEEIEIRACTIWACEMIQECYATRGERVNAVTLDPLLWLLSHEKSPDERPYHLTETIYY